MIYTVYFKRPRAVFWKKIKRVRWDSCYFINEKGIVFAQPMRILITDSEIRYEIPMLTHVFKFGPERKSVIEENMKKETGVRV